MIYVSPGMIGAALGALLCAGAGSSEAAEGPTQPNASGIEIARDGGPARLVIASELAAMPTVQVVLPSQPGHDPPERTFAGPLLWTVFERAGLLEGLGARDQARRVAVITGRDDYVAVVAFGEISPEFQAKQVIIAETVDGQPISPEHLRVVVPGDKRGARNVYDIGRIDVLSLVAGMH